jgi:hypothetical protein
MEGRVWCSQREQEFRQLYTQTTVGFIQEVASGERLRLSRGQQGNWGMEESAMATSKGQQRRGCLLCLSGSLVPPRALLQQPSHLLWLPGSQERMEDGQQ